MVWLQHGLSWLRSNKDLFVVEYEQLQKDLRSTVRGACEFIQLDTNDTMLDCLQVSHKGSYHRTKLSGPELLVFSPREVAKITGYQAIMKAYLDKRCPNLPHCLPRSQCHFADTQIQDTSSQIT